MTPSQKKCARKREYSTRKEARRAKEQASARYGKKLEFYKCPHCKDYHLTSNLSYDRYKKQNSDVHSPVLDELGG